MIFHNAKQLTDIDRFMTRNIQFSIAFHRLLCSLIEKLHSHIMEKASKLLIILNKSR